MIFFLGFFLPKLSFFLFFVCLFQCFLWCFLLLFVVLWCIFGVFLLFFVVFMLVTIGVCSSLVLFQVFGYSNCQYGCYLCRFVCSLVVLCFVVCSIMVWVLVLFRCLVFSLLIYDVLSTRIFSKLRIFFTGFQWYFLGTFFYGVFSFLF